MAPVVLVVQPLVRHVPMLPAVLMAQPLLRYVSMLPAVPVIFVRVSIYKPSYGSGGFSFTARVQTYFFCDRVSCRSRCKTGTLVHPLGVVDGRG